MRSGDVVASLNGGRLVDFQPRSAENVVETTLGELRLRFSGQDMNDTEFGSLIVQNETVDVIQTFEKVGKLTKRKRSKKTKVVGQWFD